MVIEEKQRLVKKIQDCLFELRDLKYQEFQAKLIPTISHETIIGVRMPQLRKMAKEIGKLPEAEVFLNKLPHQYYEENNIHGALISDMKDYERCIEAMEKFLPYVDNWATCDMMSPKCFKRNLPELLGRIKVWIQSDKTYTIRFGIKMLMDFYLDKSFQPEYLDWVADITSEEYYVKMMLAWYFATALAKQYETALPFIENYRLEPWIHNKTIQKAVESYRITDEHKAHLRSLRLTAVRRITKE